MEDKNFPDIHALYEEYLTFMKVKPEQMSPSERIERKRAFIAGFTCSMRVILDSASDDESEESAERFRAIVRSLSQQINQFAEDSMKEHEELIKAISN